MQNQKKNKTKTSVQKKSSALLSKIPTEFPQKLTVALTCSDLITLSPSAACGAYAEMSINSAYDPYFGVGGGVCSGFSQLAAIYQRYKVVRSKHRFVFNVVKTDDTAMIGVVPMNSTDSSPPTPAEYWDWVSETKGAICHPAFANSNGFWPTQHYIVDLMCDVRKIDGVPALDDDYTAAVNGDPVKQLKIALVVGYHNMSSSGEIQVAVQSTYYTEFYQPRCSNLAE